MNRNETFAKAEARMVRSADMARRSERREKLLSVAVPLFSEIWHEDAIIDEVVGARVRGILGEARHFLTCYRMSLVSYCQDAPHDREAAARLLFVDRSTDEVVKALAMIRESRMGRKAALKQDSSSRLLSAIGRVLDDLYGREETERIFESAKQRVADAERVGANRGVGSALATAQYGYTHKQRKEEKARTA